MAYDNNTKVVGLTIRNIPRSLTSAMNMRAQKLGMTREQMLRELLLKEFADEEKIVRAMWDKSSDEIQGELTIGGIRFHRFTNRSDAEKLCKELAKEVKIHLVFYEGFWYCPFDSTVQAFGELKLPNCIVATYEKNPKGEVVEYQK